MPSAFTVLHIVQGLYTSTKRSQSTGREHCPHFETIQTKKRSPYDDRLHAYTINSVIFEYPLITKPNHIKPFIQVY